MSQRRHLYWYRWEGVYTADFTLDGVRRRCQRFGELALQQRWSCLIAHDTRFISGQFARYVYRLLGRQGVPVSFCPAPAPIPTVELALDQKRVDCALIVSAGNRPHWYNGLVALTPSADNALLEDGSHSPGESLLDEPFPPQPIEVSEQTQVDLRTPYFEMLRSIVDVEFIRRSTLTVFVDPMHGCTIGYIPELIGEGAQTKAIEINRETDPLFGRQPPHPAEVGLNRLRKLVKESDSHLGIALSADGRALGVTDNSGELVPPHEVAALLAQYLVRQHRARGVVVLRQLSNERAAPLNWENALGLKVEEAADPPARISELVTLDRNNLLVGATATGEITIGRFHASPDALLAAMLLIELTARSGGKLRTLVDELRSRISSH